MNVKQKIVEAVSERHPHWREQEIEASALSYALDQRRLKIVLVPFVGEKTASLMCNVAGGINVSEIEDTIARFPKLSVEQVKRFFKSESMVKETALLNGCSITRPMLITMVEILEAYTGRNLKNADETLRWLDETDTTLTVKDLAEFFAFQEDSKIAKLLDKMGNDKKTEAPQMSVLTRSYLRHTVKSYLEDCFGMTQHNVNENLPISSLALYHEDARECSFTVVRWLEERFLKTVSKEFVQTKTIGELIDYFAAE